MFKYFTYYFRHVFQFLGFVLSIQILLSLTYNYQITKVGFIITLSCAFLYASSKRYDYFKDNKTKEV